MNEAQNIIELQNALQETFDTIIYIGATVISALATAVVVLFRALQKSEKYIRASDKESLKLLTEIASNYKSLGLDVSKIEKMINEVAPKVNEHHPKIMAIHEKVSLIKERISQIARDQNAKN